MALAFLVGSEGHFGQPRRRSVPNVYADSSYDDSIIIVTESEVLALVELLAFEPDSVCKHSWCPVECTADECSRSACIVYTLSPF